MMPDILQSSSFHGILQYLKSALWEPTFHKEPADRSGSDFSVCGVLYFTFLKVVILKQATKMKMKTGILDDRNAWLFWSNTIQNFKVMHLNMSLI